MKNITLTIILLAFSKIYAQTTKTTFTYDNAGNRIQRSEIIIVGKSAIATSNGQESQQLEENADGFQFTLYPNVVQNNLKIKTDERFLDEKGNQIFVHDLSGKLMHQQKIESSLEQIDFTNFSSGTFIVSIKNDVGFYSEWKVIKN